MAEKKIGKITDKLGLGRVSGSTADEQHMAQIREILFGEQTRQANNRMARIESLLSAQDTALRELLDMRIDRATKGLRDELGNQGRRQAAALDAIDAELRALLHKTDEQLTLLNSDLQDARHEAGRSLDEHARSLDRIQQGSVDRSQLAELFEGLAQQLRKTSGK